MNFGYRHLLCIVLGSTFLSCSQPVDREALVSRHKVIQSFADSLNPLSVGNGQYAFTADITGLQTFPDYYKQGIPLGNFAEWGWHSFPDTGNYSLSDVVRYYKAGADSVPYYYQFTDHPDSLVYRATRFLRENPHRMHLGLVGLDMQLENAAKVKISDIDKPLQILDLWKGELISKFNLEGNPVEVTTLCSQEEDRIMVRIRSDLIRSGRLKLKFNFPYARHEKFTHGCNLTDGNRHATSILDSGDKYCNIYRQLDTSSYYAYISWEGDAQYILNQHVLTLSPDKTKSYFEFSVLFTGQPHADKRPEFEIGRIQNQKHWKAFWQTGGAIDFSNCTDPRADELERRVVLSQYLTRIQCTGELPPQETGLTYNSWHGKFHLEMHWWHAMHFILWNRPELIEAQLDYYHTIFKQAKSQASYQGYQGVRWPKMTGPEGKESPSSIGVFLIWQQPHIIYLSEMLYQQSGQNKEVLHKYKDLVMATAEFMASYARKDSADGLYHLGPALIPAQERFSPETTIDPPFELAYWHYGLSTAQTWLGRIGLPGDEQWQRVIDNLAMLPMQDSLYLFAASIPDSYTRAQYISDHPIVLAALGFLPPSTKVDPQIMLNSLDTIMSIWNWQSCWGWDFPLAAMCATALDQPEKAIDLLLMETNKNTYLLNGHNFQDDRLRLYLPGNGGLLTAVAMMCTYKNAEGNNGFPDNGRWKVKYEHLYPLYSGQTTNFKY